MLIVTTRTHVYTEGSAVPEVVTTVRKYRHIRVNEPALNFFDAPMSEDAALNFTDMLRYPDTSRTRVDHRIGCTITYAITEED